MSRDGEESEPGNDSDQRGQWQQRAEVFIPPVVVVLVECLVFFLSKKPPWIQPVHGSLARGVGMYAIAVAAVLLLRVVDRLSVRLLRLVLVGLLFAFQLFAPFFGSFDIVFGFIQLVGNRVDGTGVAWGFFLWLLVGSALALSIRRATPRV